MRKWVHAPQEGAMKSVLDAPKEMDRANLFLNHGRSKHADSCWRCDEPWPCLTMRVIIDADHEWAQWHDKWCAALDLVGSQAERAEKAEAEIERLRAERDELATAVRELLEHVETENADVIGAIQAARLALTPRT